MSDNLQMFHGNPKMRLDVRSPSALIQPRQHENKREFNIGFKMTRLSSLRPFSLIVAVYTAQTVLVTMSFAENFSRVTPLRGGGGNHDDNRRGVSFGATTTGHRKKTNLHHSYNHHHPGNSMIASSRLLPFTATAPLFSIGRRSTTTTGTTKLNDGTTVLDAEKALPVAAEKATNANQRRICNKRILLARILLLIGVFLWGYRIGVHTNAVAEVHTNTVAGSKGLAPVFSTLRYALLIAALLYFMARNVWKSLPKWARPALLEEAGEAIAKLFGVEKNTAAVSSSSSSRDCHDLSDFGTLVGKLGGMLALVKWKLSLTNERFDFSESFFGMIRIMKHLKKKESRVGARDELYSRWGGTPTTPSDLENLDLYMDMAEWAYDEEDRPLEELLEERGYALLKHDKTKLPGYLGHYVAISRTDKTAIIGVRGTDTLGDIITDMCGQVVSVNDLPASPFHRRGRGRVTSAVLRCHEGIHVSSRRLADDLQPLIEDLLLPQGYRITVVGHSLGAASAAMLAVFLRSRIPSLVRRVDRLRVLAFAAPPILDLENALACSSFCTTIVNNCDIVPRCDVSTLLVTVEILKEIHERLDDGLLSVEELANAIDTAIGNVQWAEESYLYLPGKVILMYNQWEKEEDEKNGERAAAADVAVVTDGTAKFLRYFPFDERMLKDHYTASYKASLRSLLDKCANCKQ